MANIINIEREKLTADEKDFSEVARYLGYKKDFKPDQKISLMIKECCPEILETINARAVYQKFSLTIDGDKISFADTFIESKNLSVNLRNCKSVYMVAVTTGPLVDALIRKTQISDMVKAAVFNSCAAMFCEKVINLVNNIIKDDENKNVRPRFSPGYGDLSLDVQKIFFRLLPCSKIGLTLMDNLIMSPEKSVTAFIGSLN